jgi:multidrug resistance efflux pump
MHRAVAEGARLVSVAATGERAGVVLIRSRLLRRIWRLLRAAVAISILVGIGLIPYPLYITEPCAVLPSSRSEVRARTEGVLVEILADEGSNVRAGDVIARLEDRDTEAALARTLADIDRLRAGLAKLRAGARVEELARSEAALEMRRRAAEFAQAASDRQLALVRENLATEQDLAQSLRESTQAAGEVALAQAELDVLRAGFRREDVKAAEADLRRAELEADNLRRRLELLTLRAPIDGQIVTPKLGEQLHRHLAAGDLLLEIANLERVRIEIYVPERDFDVVHHGQPTTMKVQSFPLRPFRGNVDFVAPAVDQRSGVGVVRVVSEMDNPGGLLRENMTGYGEINAGQSNLIGLALRRVVRWVRIRFLV